MRSADLVSAGWYQGRGCKTEDDLIIVLFSFCIVALLGIRGGDPYEEHFQDPAS